MARLKGILSAQRICFYIVILFAIVVPGQAGVHDMTDELKEVLGIPRDMNPDFLRLATGPNRNYTEEQILSNGPNTVALDAAHIGGERLLFKVTFGHAVRFDDGALFHFYLDLDNNRETGRQGSALHNGVDVMITLRHDNISISSHNDAYSRSKVFAGGMVIDNTLYLLVEAPLHGDDDQIYFTAHTTAQRYFSDQRVGRSESTNREPAVIPRRHVADLPDFDRFRLASLAPLSDFRYIDSQVKYESLENKGLAYDLVASDNPDLFGREKPLPAFYSDVRFPGRAGTTVRHEVAVTVAEEYGVERREVPVTFGFPLTQGAVFDLDHFRVISPDNEEIPAQFSATSFWPDGSLKWVLIDFADHFGPYEERSYSVAFGSEVSRLADDHGRGIHIDEDDEKIIITTGPLRAQVSKKAYKLFDDIWIDANGDGIFSELERVATTGTEGVGLVDERGHVFTTSSLEPESFLFEEMGPEKVVVRVEGKYGTEDGRQYMRYVSRLTFRAESTRVHVAHTLINDYLHTEFTDVTSMYIPIETTEPIDRALVFTNDSSQGFKAHCACGSSVRLFQTDERTASINGDIVVNRPYWMAGLVPGVARVAVGDQTITAVIHEFQERWPKGIHAEGSTLSLELLPEQPSAEYGSDLPYHLMFPFVSGKYRFKWGNSFTERITIDFGNESSAEELAAEGQFPAVAVIPPEWYNETKVLGPVAVSNGDRVALWNRFVSDSYLENIRAKIAAREYGYFNYGDWFGERDRNWGNNEYDLAHGFFMEFIRTGDRRYHRLALTAARHQADIDIIHAYPDPTFVGANARHSVGHTGEWTERANHATWSRAFDSSFMASNGHTWADGMMDAWFLSGDARVMEGALALGEHIAWSMAPAFRELGTHERSAGWSLKAIMALYRGTYDPVYLKAARQIVAVALSEQDLGGSGAWPHPLPTDHSGNRLGTVGNNLYLIGILLGGLQAYHDVTDDPDVLQSLKAGVDWVMKSWNPERGGWPYSAAVDGDPLYVENANLNTIITSAIAYVAALREDEELLDVVAAAMDAHVRSGTKNDGKSIGMTLHFASEILARLEPLSDRSVTQWIEVASPQDGQRLSGAFPVEIALLQLEHDEGVKRVEVDVDGVAVYSSFGLPKDGLIFVDSEPFRDGNYTVNVAVEHEQFGLSRDSRKVTIENRWSLVQAMMPPVSRGWFGEIDYLETEKRSPGWGYDTDFSETFFGDGHRLVRETDDTEYLMWKTPRLQQFKLDVYAQSDVFVAQGLEIALSTDGTEWYVFEYDPRMVDTSGKWDHTVINGSFEGDVSWNWFRLTMTDTVSKESLQIGNVSFGGLRGEK